jgi:hypothetical protein
MVIALLNHNFKWLPFISVLGMPIALSMGYGGDTLGKKIVKRALYGLLFGSCGFAFGLLYGNPILAFSQLVLAIVVSIVFGVLNPVAAVNEEALVALLSVCLVPFMVAG